LQVLGEAPVGVKDRLAVSGRAWQVIRADAQERRYYVRPAPGRVPPGIFPRRPALGRFFRFLPPDLQALERRRHMGQPT
jgi:hypothetical protein